MSVPKLRFPEFWDECEWEDKPLGVVYLFKATNSFSRDKLNYRNGSINWTVRSFLIVGTKRKNIRIPKKHRMFETS